VSRLRLSKAWDGAGDTDWDAVERGAKDLAKEIKKDSSYQRFTKLSKKLARGKMGPATQQLWEYVEQRRADIVADLVPTSGLDPNVVQWVRANLIGGKGSQIYDRLADRMKSDINPPYEMEERWKPSNRVMFRPPQGPIMRGPGR